MSWISDKNARRPRHAVYIGFYNTSALEVLKTPLWPMVPCLPKGERGGPRSKFRDEFPLLNSAFTRYPFDRPGVKFPDFPISRALHEIPFTPARPPSYIENLGHTNVFGLGPGCAPYKLEEMTRHRKCRFHRDFRHLGPRNTQQIPKLSLGPIFSATRCLSRFLTEDRDIFILFPI